MTAAFGTVCRPCVWRRGLQGFLKLPMAHAGGHALTIGLVPIQHGASQGQLRRIITEYQAMPVGPVFEKVVNSRLYTCLLYTSDAADE